MRDVKIKHPVTGKKTVLVDEYEHIAFISDDDIEWTDPGICEYINTAKKHLAPYGFYFENFRFGAALAVWTLYPDGRYFEDEDGFGGENCNETTVYAYFDENLKALIKFQTMDRDALKENFIKAVRKAGKITEKELKQLLEGNE